MGAGSITDSGHITGFAETADCERHAVIFLLFDNRGVEKLDAACSKTTLPAGSILQECGRYQILRRIREAAVGAV